MTSIIFRDRELEFEFSDSVNLNETYPVMNSLEC